MFEFVRTHTRLLQFVLVLLIFPSFVFFGIQGYSRFTEGANASVAKVDGQAITQGEWDAAHRSQIERMRRQMPNLDPKLLDAPEVKWRRLDNMVNQRVLNTAADKLHVSVSDQRLLELMQKDPELAPLRNADGSIDLERYQRALADAGMTPRSYEAKY